MDNRKEPKVLLEVEKDTVSTRLELPKKTIHKRAMKKHATNPRAWNFHDTLIDLIDKGLKSEKIF